MPNHSVRLSKKEFETVFECLDLALSFQDGSMESDDWEVDAMEQVGKAYTLLEKIERRAKQKQTQGQKA